MTHTFSLTGEKLVDPQENQAKAYPAYWRPLPQNWKAVDTYRIDQMFPLPSSRLYHARKKLLVPGVRTGGKTLRQDVQEAVNTLQAWLDDTPED